MYFDGKYGVGRSGSGSINTNPDYFDGTNTDSEIRPKKSFAAFKFYILEKKLGIKINGEIRKFFNINQRPYVTINLSKSINLSTLKDLFSHEENNL